MEEASKSRNEKAQFINESRKDLEIIGQELEVMKISGFWAKIFSSIKIFILNWFSVAVIVFCVVIIIYPKIVFNISFVKANIVESNEEIRIALQAYESDILLLANTMNQEEIQKLYESKKDQLYVEYTVQNKKHARVFSLIVIAFSLLIIYIGRLMKGIDKRNALLMKSYLQTKTIIDDYAMFAELQKEEEKHL